MKSRTLRWCCTVFLISPLFHADAAQTSLQKLTVGYTPISGAAYYVDRILKGAKRRNSPSSSRPSSSW